MRIKIKTMVGRDETIKADGAMILFSQGDRVGMYLTGMVEAIRLAEGLAMTIEQMDPGSEEEDMMINFVMRVCALSVRSEKILDAMRFKAETAEMIRDILDKEDETDE